MHHSMTATSALLFLFLASAPPAAATPSTSGTDQSDDSAALSASNNLFAGSFTVAHNLLPWVKPVAALLSVSPPNDVESSDIQFPPPHVNEFESWLGPDWQP